MHQLTGENWKTVSEVVHSLAIAFKRPSSTVPVVRRPRPAKGLDIDAEGAISGESLKVLGSRQRWGGIFGSF